MHSSVKRAIVGLLLTLLALTSQASATVSPYSVPEVLLKLNHYYLLYTYPVSPVLDSRGRILVSLPVTGEVLGATVVTNSPTVHRVTRGGRTLMFVLGWDVVETDGRRLSLGEPIQRAGSMMVGYRAVPLMVPLGVLVDVFGLQAKWDAVFRVLSLQSDRLVPPHVVQWLERDIANREEKIIDTEDLVPGAVSIQPVLQNGIPKIVVQFSLRNRLGRTVPEAKLRLLDVAMYVANSGASGMYPQPVSPAREPEPCTKVRDGFHCRIYYPREENFSPMKYVLVRIMRRP